MRHNWSLAIFLWFTATMAQHSSGQGLPQPLIPKTTRVDAKLVREYKTETGALIRVYESPEQWSGHGRAPSDQYMINTPPSPAGFHLSRQSFELRGDRNCYGTGEGVQPFDFRVHQAEKVHTLSPAYFDLGNVGMVQSGSRADFPTDARDHLCVLNKPSGKNWIQYKASETSIFSFIKLRQLYLSPTFLEYGT